MAIDTAAGAVSVGRRSSRSVWGQARVVAILPVTGSAGLTRVLDALAQQTRMPDAVVAVLDAALPAVEAREAAELLTSRSIPIAETPAGDRVSRGGLRDQVAAALRFDRPEEATSIGTLERAERARTEAGRMHPDCRDNRTDRDRQPEGCEVVVRR